MPNENNNSSPTIASSSTNNHSKPYQPRPQQLKEEPQLASMSRRNRRWWPTFAFSLTPTTTDNVIELLWDVALAFFAVRLALLYAALVVGSSVLIHLLLASAYLHFPAPLPVPVPIIVMLACSAFWARVVVKWCEVPPVMGFRFAVGGAAVMLVLLAEGLAGFVWCEVLGRHGMGMMMGGWMSSLGVLAAFGLMPALLMTVGIGGKGEEGRAVRLWEGPGEK